MNFLFKTLVLLLISTTAYAASVSFEKMQEFHDNRVNVLLNNYGLSESIEVSVLLSVGSEKKLNDYKKSTRVRLPGLLLGGIEEPESQTAGVFEIIQNLQDYKRDITIIKKRSVAKEDISALRSGLREYLALKNDEKINVQEQTFNFSNAMKNWKIDLKRAVYQSFFKSEFWALIPVALIVLFAFSVFFASSFRKVFKGLGESIEKSAATASEQTAPSNDNDGGVSAFNDVDMDNGFKDISEVGANQIFEVDSASILEKVFHLHKVAKFELFNILWSFMPSAEKQISFYELMSNDMSPEQSVKFKEIFFEVFKLTPSSISNMKAGDFLTSQELAKLHKSLLCAELIDVDPKREQALAAVFPKHGGVLEKIIESSLEQFFSVIYYLFPDKVLDLLNTSPEMSKKISNKVALHLSKPQSDQHPNELEIKGFVGFLEKGVFFEGESELIDEKTMRLLYSIPDSAIFNAENWDQEYKKRILQSLPNVNWISNTDASLLKKFFLNISEQEVYYVSEEHPNFSSLFDVLDERGQLRVQEKIGRGKATQAAVNIPLFRAKLKKVFKPLKVSEEVESDEVSYAA